MVGKPLVPWTRWPQSSRELLAVEMELGERAAWHLIVTPFVGYHGSFRP
jgi:hypothetical protein